jgi:threonine dehydratase
MAVNNISITMDDVHLAQKNIAHVVRQTPTVLALGARLSERQIYFKCENLQITGSFKIRGSLNKICQLTDEEQKKGVIAASAGNHAQGVAKSSQLFKVKSKIVMPETAPLIKVSSTKSYGAEVILHGRYFDEAFEKAQELAQKEGLVFVHPYEDSKVIAGQGTIGLEVLQTLPEIKNVIVPIGGGGLISGIAYVIKQFQPHCRVIGVVSDQAPGMLELKSGKTMPHPQRVSTIADGIAVKRPSQNMFKNYIDPYVDQIVSVSDEEISQAIVYAMETEKTILEGSGAAGLAAILCQKVELLPGPSCVLLCGGNIDLNTISSVIDTGLRRQGRLARISTIVSDLPGELAFLTRVFADQGANVLDVIHDRVSPELSLRQTRIDFLIETSSFEHIERIKEQIKNHQISILER